MSGIDGNITLIRWLRRLVVGGVALLVLLVQIGFFDPVRPQNEVVFRYTAAQGCAIHEAVLAESAALTILWQEAAPMELALGDRESPDLVLRLDPQGYVGLRGDGVERPLQTFPHVEAAENEIWLDVVEGTAVEIRINREIYWQGEVKIEDMSWWVFC